MPTPSEPQLRGEWTARTATARRSVFGNYRADDACPGATESAPADSYRGNAPARSDPATLQTAIDLAVARSFIHRFLAKAYEDPAPEGWAWLADSATQQGISASSRVCGVSALPAGALQVGEFQDFLDAYLAAFGHAARGGCPLNEIEYGDIKADPLFQPHRLADLAAFYRAFGLEVAGNAGERHDHICLELEFMCVLAAKEAYALEHQHDANELAQCRDAQKNFLREHLGRWTPAFARRLVAATGQSALRALAEFTRAFVESECARFGVAAGSEDLLLRPVDEAADSLCASCGIRDLPPGALTTT